MRLIKPSVEILEQYDLFQHIEKCGRTAYKSEDKITEESAKPFVDMIIKRGHTAVLEQGTIYLNIPNSDWLWVTMKKYEENKYSIVTYKEPGTVDCWYITTNYRVLVENNWLEDLQYQCAPTEYHEKRITVKFICPISISREFNRHRVHSIVEQSTRYCNYSKDKFGNEVTFIIPEWLTLPEGHYICLNGNMCGPDQHDKNLATETYLYSLRDAEKHYLMLLDNGWKPQQAREVLPLNTATELIHTAFVSDWKHFFKLRCAPDAHPQARELAIPLMEVFKERGYLK